MPFTRYTASFAGEPVAVTETWTCPVLASLPKNVSNCMVVLLSERKGLIARWLNRHYYPRIIYYFIFRTTHIDQDSGAFSHCYFLFFSLKCYELHIRCSLALPVFFLLAIKNSY